MSWLLWIPVAVMVAGVFIMISTVGKERKPITPAAAALTTFFAAVYIACIVVGGGLLS